MKTLVCMLFKRDEEQRCAPDVYVCRVLGGLNLGHAGGNIS